MAKALFLAFLLVFLRTAAPANSGDEGSLPPMPPILPGEYLAPPAMQEAHSDELVVGKEAPVFSLPALDGSAEVDLGDFQGRSPVILIFGSYSCPVFRGQIEELNRLYERYKEKARFFLVYIREAHPDSRVYLMREGKKTLETISQTDAMPERLDLARRTVETFHLTLPTLIDRPGNETNAAYAGWPVRFVAIGVDGKIAYKGRLGPWGFWPEELAAWLAESLLKPAYPPSLFGSFWSMIRPFPRLKPPRA